MAKSQKKPAAKPPKKKAAPKKKAPAKKKATPKKTTKKADAKGPGRPTVMTKKVVEKLEKLFSQGLSDREACLLAGISKDALYDYCNENPVFSNRKEELKKTPSIHAKQTMARAVKKDPKMALKLLERKERNEWAPPTVKQDINLTNEVGDKTDDQIDEELAAIEAEIAKSEGAK